MESMSRGKNEGSVHRSSYNFAWGRVIVIGETGYTKTWKCKYCKRTFACNRYRYPNRVKKHLTGIGKGAGNACPNMTSAQRAAQVEAFAEHEAEMNAKGIRRKKENEAERHQQRLGMQREKAREDICRYCSALRCRARAPRVCVCVCVCVCREDICRHCRALRRVLPVLPRQEYVCRMSSNGQ